MRIPENNSLKAEIEELLQLCKDSEAEYGENASYFNDPISEQEMAEWEETNGVKIPESYKEWLRFTGKCRIVSNTASFWGPKEFHSNFVPEDLVVIGEMIGDGEMVCFSKSKGEFVRFFEGKENGIYKEFNSLLKIIKRTLSNESILPDDALKLFAELLFKNSRKEGDNK